MIINRWIRYFIRSSGSAFLRSKLWKCVSSEKQFNFSLISSWRKIQKFRINCAKSLKLLLVTPIELHMKSWWIFLTWIKLFTNRFAWIRRWLLAIAFAPKRLRLKASKVTKWRLRRECESSYRCCRSTTTQVITVELLTNILFTWCSSCAEFFHDPEAFLPERFDAEHGGVKAYKDRGVLVPFGDGPRICLGMRFALLQLKAAAFEIVTNFKITVDPKMSPGEKLEIDPEELLMNVKKGGLWLNFEAIWMNFILLNEAENKASLKIAWKSRIKNVFRLIGSWWEFVINFYTSCHLIGS